MSHHFSRRWAALGLSILSAWTVSAQAASLQGAADKLGVQRVQSIEFSGAGRWFQFGQAPAPDLPWPQFDVSRYVASIDYARSASRVQIQRLQTIEPDRARPAPVVQRVDQYVSEGRAWNVGVAPAPAAVSAQPAALDERVAEIWSTPQGFVKAALAHQAQSRAVPGGVEVRFSAGGKVRYEGLINEQDEVTQVRTWVDNPVLGDTPYVTEFSHYVSREGVPFPLHIVRSFGGHRVLDLTVADVKLNAVAAWSVPAEAVAAPAVKVQLDRLADGVFYATGGTHHSVVIEQRDHLVLVEAPLNEARSQALLDALRQAFPGKPVRELVNTHLHFDHSGGLRTFVAEGARIVTHEANVPYYRQAWAQPRTLSPDRQARAPKAARFLPLRDRVTLGEGTRRVEVLHIVDNTHNDAFALVYLPDSKILIEADAYTPLAAGAPVPTSANPFSVNLLENVERRGLAVERIAALHGPGVVSLQDLKVFIGRPVAGR